MPISDELSLIRRGAAGHTPTMAAFEWGTYGWLFPDGLGGDRRPMYVSKLVGVALPPGYTMHTLRDRFASRAYRGSRNLRAVQTLLGHSSIATTRAVGGAPIKNTLPVALLYVLLAVLAGDAYRSSVLGSGKPSLV